MYRRIIAVFGLISLLIQATAVPAFSQNVSLTELNRDLSYWKPRDRDGVNTFEIPKEEGVKFDDPRVRIGGQFALQFQALDHSNEAVPRLNDDGEDLNQLLEINNNFNLATANMDIDVQLARGIRSHLRVYLSSRHHHEPYVKDGYLLVNRLDFVEDLGIIDQRLIDDVMDFVTLKIGHMEINYGDLHFRRSDNAQVVYNPFVGNPIMDSFSTEVAGEIYFRTRGWLAMFGLTNGKLDQSVGDEGDGLAILGKLGFDRNISEDFRLRVMASIYNIANANPVRLYSADRAGSRYYLVTENNEDAFRSGRFDPGYGKETMAVMFDTFMKYKGAELFLVFENVTGRGRSDTSDQSTYHYLAELIYRFGAKENFYFGARYNLVDSEPSGFENDITIDRINVGGGWFLTDNMLMKLEYVNQQYDDYPPTNRLHEAEFDGFVVETLVTF